MVVKEGKIKGIKRMTRTALYNMDNWKRKKRGID